MDWVYSKLLVEHSNMVETGSLLADIMTTRIVGQIDLGLMDESCEPESWKLALVARNFSRRT